MPSHPRIISGGFLTPGIQHIVWSMGHTLCSATRRLNFHVWLVPISWSASPRMVNHAVLQGARHGSGYPSSSDLGLPFGRPTQEPANVQACAGSRHIIAWTSWSHTALRAVPRDSIFRGVQGMLAKNSRASPRSQPQGAKDHGTQAVFPGSLLGFPLWA